MTGVRSETVELSLPADAAYLELVGEHVTFLARRTGFDERDVARIRLAVDEACANAVIHVDAVGLEAPSFRVICEREGTRLTIRVQDNGAAFDLEAVREPDLGAPLEKRQVGGLGIYLMRRVMDKVEVRPREGGKEIVLVKELRGGEDPADGC